MAKLLTVVEAAEVLNTSERHIRRMVFERRIPFMKVGGKVRFDSEDLERWLKTNRVTAVAAR